MFRYFIKRVIIVFLHLALATLYFCPSAAAQSEEEMRVLRMFYKEKDLVVSPTRQQKPIAQVAENITVITADEIEEMNAHTLTEVLNTIPGVQMDIRGGPGGVASAYIQGSEFRNVLVMIDGVTLNNISDNFADISAIPVQHIERIEIIKGPASSAWGSSLGGIINIITKPAGDSKTVGGMLSASYGERNTGDYRAEASGSVGNIGYYLYTGNLVSDGMGPNTPFYENSIYTKLRWDMTKKASLLLTFGYNKGDRGMGEWPGFDLSFSNDFEYLFSTLSLDYSINDRTDLSLSLRTSRQNTEHYQKQLSTGTRLGMNTYYEKGNGGSAKLTWRGQIQSLVIGTDFDNGELESNSITDGRQDLERWAVFANDTIVINKFSFTPGVRYDHTSTNGDFLSPSLGVTYRLTEKTVLRAYVARGFSTPPLSYTFGTGFFFKPNTDLGVEKVWSVLAGIESAALRYLWLKATLFRHDVWDALSTEQLPDGTFIFVNKDKQRRQGVEVELKTAPLYDTSLFAGFAFLDAKSRDTGERLQNIARYTYDIGLKYNDNRSLRASLRGRYIWWNAETSLEGRYSSFIWDLNLMKRVYKSEKGALEVFLSAHNIFNGSQYLQWLFRNPERWVEGGVRLRF